MVHSRQSRMASSEVKAILNDHPSLVLDLDCQKVTCSLTKHEMPLTVTAIETYVNGKKYKKVSGMAAFNFEKHKMHIVPSNKKKHLHEMFCTLTLRHIQKTPEAIQRHISGRKYRNALSRWLKCQETGEKFVPHVRRKSKLPRSFKTMKDDDNDDPFHDSDERQSDQDSDNMSDLYPDEDFDDEDVEDEEEEDDKEEEDEEEEEEEENMEPTPTKNSTKKQKQTEEKKKKDSLKESQDQSDSDYDMNVIEVSNESTSQTKASKVSKQKCFPETKAVASMLKRKFEGGDNENERIIKEKKKKKKKNIQ